MLKGAPKIGEVIGDFCKFCDGCLLVGHNVQFDYKFIHYYAEQEEYIFEHKTYDTISIAQGMLFLPNYKLNTLADHYHDLVQPSPGVGRRAHDGKNFYRTDQSAKNACQTRKIVYTGIHSEYVSVGLRVGSRSQIFLCAAFRTGWRKSV